MKRSIPTKRELAARAFAWSGLSPLLNKTWRGVLTLCYHRVAQSSEAVSDLGLWSAVTDVFDTQIAYVKRAFDVVGPADLADVLGKKAGRHVLITFDDGYRDNYLQAFPVLRSRGVSATFFLSTGYLDNPRLPWWDEIAWMVNTSPRPELKGGPWFTEKFSLNGVCRAPVYERLIRQYKKMNPAERPGFLNYLAEVTGSGRASADLARDTWLTWDMVREMRAGGMELGGHTVNHPLLSELPAEEQEREIKGCQDRLRSELGNPSRWFSYPQGGHDESNPVTQACLLKHGFEIAFTHYGGYQTPGQWNPFDVARVPAEHDWSWARFSSTLSLPQIFASR